MRRTIKEYKEIQQLNYSVYHNYKDKKPYGWTSLGEYTNPDGIMFAEAFKNQKDEVFLVIRGTSLTPPKTASSDLENDCQLFVNTLPERQKYVNFAYCDLVNKYGKENVVITGYSLGASLGVILGNETGAETIAFEPYGVGNIVKSKNVSNIINFGNERDLIFTKNLDNQIGEVYVIPNDGAQNRVYSEDTTEADILGGYYHFPNNSGDLAKAVRYEGPASVLKGSVTKTNEDDIFSYKNRVYYKGETFPIEEFDDEDANIFWDQALEPNGLPTKEELDARTKSGELIYVDAYTRSDGTKVSGYYRRCP